jgi:uncharacterized membrane-anchored protein YitT (DUF2179 family)
MATSSLIKEIREFKPDLSWKNLKDYGVIILGGIVQGLAMRFFLVPAHLVSGGISGLAQLIANFTDFPIGAMILLGNIPLFILGFRYLGALRFALRTAVAVVTFSLFTDLVGKFFPLSFTNDLILQSLYGGVLYGVGSGLVYRGKGTSGGSDILCRILNHYTGISISQGYLLTDSIVVHAGGFIFGWDVALYGVAVIYIAGIAAEAIAEGTNRYRTAFIITNCPKIVTDYILQNMDRGVTIFPAIGGFTQQERPMLFCTLTASEIPKLKTIVSEADPSAFMVIGQANEALGEGFTPFRNH